MCRFSTSDHNWRKTLWAEWLKVFSEITFCPSRYFNCRRHDKRVTCERYVCGLKSVMSVKSFWFYWSDSFLLFYPSLLEHQILHISWSKPIKYPPLICRLCSFVIKCIFESYHTKKVFFMGFLGHSLETQSCSTNLKYPWVADKTVWTKASNKILMCKWWVILQRMKSYSIYVSYWAVQTFQKDILFLIFIPRCSQDSDTFERLKLEYLVNNMKMGLLLGLLLRPWWPFLYSLLVLQNYHCRFISIQYNWKEGDNGPVRSKCAQHFCV